MHDINVRNSRKDKKVSSKSANVEMTEAASIQGSPTEITYAETTKAFGGDTHSASAIQYDYARTGPISVRFLANTSSLTLLYVCTN